MNIQAERESNRAARALFFFERRTCRPTCLPPHRWMDGHWHGSTCGRLGGRIHPSRSNASPLSMKKRGAACNYIHRLSHPGVLLRSGREHRTTDWGAPSHRSPEPGTPASSAVPSATRTRPCVQGLQGRAAHWVPHVASNMHALAEWRDCGRAAGLQARGALRRAPYACSWLRCLHCQLPRGGSHVPSLFSSRVPITAHPCTLCPPSHH